MSKKPEEGTSRAARRAERREAAIAREKQQKRMRLLMYAGIAAVAVAAILVVINLQRDSGSTDEIDFSGIPSTGTTLGDPNAPVTIVEYADYQCPFCAVFGTEDFPQIVDDFVRTGQVKIEFRAHPFLGTADLRSPDNESVQPAVAAACALDQDRFWEYNHALFVRHDGENQGTFSRENLNEIAEDVGLDMTTFGTCMDEQTHLDEVLASLEQQTADGISSTPTILINGVQVAYTREGYDRLKTQIEAAINGEAIPQ